MMPMFFYSQKKNSRQKNAHPSGHHTSFRSAVRAGVLRGCATAAITIITFVLAASATFEWADAAVGAAAGRNAARRGAAAPAWHADGRRAGGERRQRDPPRAQLPPPRVWPGQRQPVLVRGGSRLCFLN